MLSIAAMIRKLTQNISYSSVNSKYLKKYIEEHEALRPKRNEYEKEKEKKEVAAKSVAVSPAPWGAGQGVGLLGRRVAEEARRLGRRADGVAEHGPGGGAASRTHGLRAARSDAAGI